LVELTVNHFHPELVKEKVLFILDDPFSSNHLIEPWLLLNHQRDLFLIGATDWLRFLV
jgi:hypothetical protein